MSFAKQIIITILFSSMAFISQAKPYWIDELPDSDHFMYFRGEGVNADEQEAQKSAVINALFDVAHFKKSQINAFTESNQSTVLTKTESYEYDVTSKQIQLYGVGSDITGLRVVAENSRQENEQYHYTVLVRLPKSANSASLPIYKRQKAAPFFKSTVLPGWGQFAKHDDTKAYLIVASTGLSLLSALSFKVIGDHYLNTSLDNTLSYEEQHANRENADTAYLYGNIALSVAGIVYVYNVIDAISINANPLFTRANTNPHLNLSISKDHYSMVCIVRF